MGILNDWHDYMSKVAQGEAERRRSIETGLVTDTALQRVDVELLDENPLSGEREWRTYHAVLFKSKGLCFFHAASNFDEGRQHVRALPLENILHAAHAYGPDYYDGVIDVDLVDGTQE